MKQYLTLVVLASFMAVSLQAEDVPRSMTETFPETNFTPVEIPIYQNNNSQSETAYPRKSEIGLQESGDWILTDSLKINGIVTPGEFIGVSFDYQKKSMSIDRNYMPAEKAASALDLVPEMMRESLLDNFSKMKSETVEEFAEIIIDAEAKYRDEIAFVIANTSVETLQTPHFNSALLLDNAETIYMLDEELEFVEIIENEDGTSTTEYKRVNAESESETVRVPVEVYYWYVVHPKLSDELPAYINPALADPNRTGANVAAPPTGKFWRSYLYTVTEKKADSEEYYPVLKNMLESSNHIWNDALPKDSSAALRIMTKWIKSVMKFDSKQERPIQPCRIYTKHLGRCGEHEDLAGAVSRLCLIPCRGISSTSTDHVWNEYWDKDWQQWEPVNNSFRNKAVYGQDGWGKMFGTVYSRRSDGLTEGVTTQGYCDSTATFKFRILDANGKPLDGALFSLYMARVINDETYIVPDSYHFVDAEGNIEIEVGHRNVYFARIDSKFGSLPEEAQKVMYLTNNGAKTVNGQTYSGDIKLNVNKEYPTTITFGENIDSEDMKIEVSYDLKNITKAMVNDFVRNQEIRDNPHGNTKAHLLLLSGDEYEKCAEGAAFAAGNAEYVLSSETDETVTLTCPFKQYSNLAIFNSVNAENMVEVEADIRLYFAPELSSVDDESDISIYPIPFEDNLNIELSSFSCPVSIFDGSGKKVHSSFCTTGSNSLSLETLSPGVYFISLEKPSGRKSYKVIKK